MKKFLILFFMFCALPALAETISAVSFNPMRMGNFFSSLKASKGFITRGGLYVRNESGTSCEGISDGTLEVRGTTAKINNLTSAKMYEIGKIDTPTFSIAPSSSSEVKVSFKRMRFRNLNGPDTTDAILNDPHQWFNLGAHLRSFGGLATFEENSRVQNLNFPAFNVTKDCFSAAFSKTCVDR